MAQQNSWKYCKKETEQHPILRSYPTCKEKIHDLSKAEGAKKSPFTHEICINLDKIEIQAAKNQNRSRNSTMDFSIGVINNNQKKFVLCEFRLNYQNVDNLKKRELDAKVTSSKALLGQDPAIHNTYIYIFSSSLKNQAYRRIRQLYCNKSTSIVLDLNDFKNEFF